MYKNKFKKSRDEIYNISHHNASVCRKSKYVLDFIILNLLLIIENAFISYPDFVVLLLYIQIFYNQTFSNLIYP